MTFRLSTRWHSCAFIGALMLVGCNEKDAPSVVAPSSADADRPVAIARGKTDVQGGLLRLSFPAEGMISKVLVSEGQSVEKDQLLVQQDNRVFLAEKRVAEGEQAVANAQLAGLRIQLPSLQQAATRLKLAAQAGASQMQLSDEAWAAFRQAQANVTASESEATLAKNKLSLLEVRGTQLNLRAPLAGTVIKLTAQPGEFASVQHNVLLLLPNRPVIVRAELNESYLAAVKVGMAATVQIDDGSGRTPLPSAHISRISPVFMQSQLQDNTQQAPGRVVECTLEFDSPPSVRIGQNVIVSFYDKT